MLHRESASVLLKRAEIFYCEYASECTMVTSVFLRAGHHVIGDFQPNAHPLIIVR